MKPKQTAVNRKSKKRSTQKSALDRDPKRIRGVYQNAKNSVEDLWFALTAPKVSAPQDNVARYCLEGVAHLILLHDAVYGKRGPSLMARLRAIEARDLISSMPLNDWTPKGV
jgi:hypothetical protein